MKYGRILFALAALTLSACVQQNQFGYTVDYSMPVLTTFKKHSTSVDISRKEYLTVGVDTVKLMVMCRNGDVRTFVDVIAPAHVSKSHIDIVSAVSKTVKFDGDKTCTASLAKSVMTYEVRYGDSLFTTPAGGQTAFYGYRVDRRPQFLERMKRLGSEAWASVKDTAGDLKDAADDEIAQKVILYRKGTAATMNAIKNGAQMYGDTMYKSGMMVPMGPM